MADKPLTILCIKTNKGCFISDCKATSGYDFDYHYIVFDKLFFDDEHPTETYCNNLYFIK